MLVSRTTATPSIQSLSKPSRLLRAYHSSYSATSPRSSSRTFQARKSLFVSTIHLRMAQQRNVSDTGHVLTGSYPGKYEYLVHIPDHANALDKRLSVRPKHLENLQPHIDAKKVNMGGAWLEKQPADGEQPKMKGSVLLLKADSEKDALDFLRSDIYCAGGAWDVDNAVVYPFKCAVRTAI